MKDKKDFWSAEDFEDTVASALIACFETKAKKNRGASPADRLTDERIASIRREGPYISSGYRVIEANEGDGNWTFDVRNDDLPRCGMIAFRPAGLNAQENPRAYLFLTYVRQVSNLGKYWEKRKSGTLYEMLNMSAESNWIDGDRRYFTVTKDGDVVACTQRIQNINRGVGRSQKIEVGPDDIWHQQTSADASITLQSLSDRRFCWTITAQETFAKAHIGCMQEEIKSLLYARSLPMTATGRKRPILHLVESHKRRMKSGTDVDVSAFLRGQQVVEIGGTVFSVNPPIALAQSVSMASQNRFFANSAC